MAATKIFEGISRLLAREAIMVAGVAILFLAFGTTFNLPVSNSLTSVFLILTSALLLSIPIMDFMKKRHKLITGPLLTLSGIGVILYGILPHFIVAAYDKSVFLGPQSGLNSEGPAILVIPPINYWLIGTGTALIGAGIFLIVAGLVEFGRYGRQRSHSQV